MLSFKSSRLFQVQWTDFVQCDVSVASKERERTGTQAHRHQDCSSDNGNPSQDANKETTQQQQANTLPEGDQVPCNELPASVCSLGVCVVVKMRIMRG